MGTQARVEQMYTFTHLMAVLLLFFFFTNKNDLAVFILSYFFIAILHNVIGSNIKNF